MERENRNNSSTPNAIIYGPNHMVSVNNDFGGFKVIIRVLTLTDFYTLSFIQTTMCSYVQRVRPLFTRQDADNFKTLARKYLGVGFCTQEQFLEICEIVSV